jgi:hypothetical protein
MTEFVKERFCRRNGLYLAYRLDESSPHYDPREKDVGKYVANFVYEQGNINHYRAFLMKNFTVEEFFDRMAAGETPCEIAESKGFIPPYMRRLLKAENLAATPANRDYLKQLIKARAEARWANMT